MYYANYSHPYNRRPEPSSDADFLFDPEVYAVADKYEVRALLKHAHNKFKTSRESSFTTYAPWFKTTIIGFSHGAGLIYKTRPSSKDLDLRIVVVDVSHRHITEFLECEEFVEAFQQIADFSADLVQDLILHEKNRERLSIYRCPSCKDMFKAEILDISIHHCLLCGHRDDHWWDFIVLEGIDLKALNIERKLSPLETWINGGK